MLSDCDIVDLMTVWKCPEIYVIIDGAIVRDSFLGSI